MISFQHGWPSVCRGISLSASDPGRGTGQDLHSRESPCSKLRIIPRDKLASVRFPLPLFVLSSQKRWPLDPTVRSVSSYWRSLLSPIAECQTHSDSYSSWQIINKLLLSSTTPLISSDLVKIGSKMEAWLFAGHYHPGSVSSIWPKFDVYSPICLDAPRYCRWHPQLKTSSDTFNVCAGDGVNLNVATNWAAPDSDLLSPTSSTSPARTVWNPKYWAKSLSNIWIKFPVLR